MNHSDNDFVDLIARQLDARPVDPAVARRLRGIRAGALARISSRTVPWFHAPAVAGAMAIAFVALIIAMPGTSPSLVLPTELMFDTLLTEHDLELIEELEFYRWLDANGYAG